MGNYNINDNLVQRAQLASLTPVIINLGNIKSRRMEESLHVNKTHNYAPHILARSTRAIENIFAKATRAAFRGGISGAVAGILQVICLMWLRTTISFQYKYGLSMKDAISKLYHQGGLPRFYRGVTFALVQTPLSRFGSVAANEGALVLSSKLFSGQYQTFFASVLGSIFVSLWRIILMPIDTCKTVLQVDNMRGYTIIVNKVFFI